jgi:hypothetical protein
MCRRCVWMIFCVETPPPICRLLSQLERHQIASCSALQKISIVFSSSWLPQYIKYSSRSVVKLLIRQCAGRGGRSGDDCTRVSDIFEHIASRSSCESTLRHSISECRSQSEILIYVLMSLLRNIFSTTNN